MPHIYRMHYTGKPGRTRCGHQIRGTLTQLVTDNINDVTCQGCIRSYKRRKPPIHSRFDPACKTCPSCYRVNPNARKKCYHCAYPFRGDTHTVRVVFTSPTDDGMIRIPSDAPRNAVYALVGPFTDHTSEPELQDAISMVAMRRNRARGLVSDDLYDKLTAQYKGPYA